MVKPSLHGCAKHSSLDKDQLSKRMSAAFFLGGVMLGIAMPALASAGTSSEVLYINQHEGGSGDQAYIDALESWLHAQQCPVNVEVSSVQPDAGKNARYHFSVRLSPATFEVPIKAFKDSPLKSTWLVLKSRGVDSLNHIKGERIALVNQKGEMMAKEPLRLLEQAGLGINDFTVFESGSNQGAMVLLSHGDVFAASIPLPLANRWAFTNGLSIIARSDITWQAGIEFHGSNVEPLDSHCRKAFASLHKEGHRDMRMKVFPEWVDGFGGL